MYLAETVWQKPKEGYLTLDEYNNIMDQSRAVHEVQAQREKKFMVENADELAAKYNREKLKQRRAEYEAKQQQQAKRDQDKQRPQKRGSEVRERIKSEDDDDDREEEETFNYPAPAPFGQWQTVQPKVEKPYVDLQLPDQSRHQYVAPVISVVDEPKPMKVFKEKVVPTLDKETTSSDAGVFKKRKINITLKKSSRQRTEDY